jgi:hypothetical protein
MTRKSPQHVAEPGQDSFLDIVANLVGILIILITVIGARATDAMVHATPNTPSAEDEPEVDVAAARAAADAVEAGVHKIDEKIKRQQLEIAYRRKERDKFLQVIGVAEERLNERRAVLDDSQQQQLDMNRNLLAARNELEDLKANRHTLENSTPPQNVIEHLPTPMAKTVFGKEVHFRLQAGRVAYVPWDELVKELREEAPQKIWKLKDAPRITEVIGPVRGFRMKYTLRHARHVTPVPGGAVSVAQRIELDRFILVPIREDLGEPLEHALRDLSEFRSILSRYNPDRTTVTVWVYPDSFNQFRTLKAELYRLGFVTAGRPMPEGHPIGGSPEGSRSASQ